VIEKVEKAMEQEDNETNIFKQKSNRTLKELEQIDPNNPNEVTYHRFKAEKEYGQQNVKLCTKCLGIYSKI